MLYCRVQGATRKNLAYQVFAALSQTQCACQACNASSLKVQKKDKGPSAFRELRTVVYSYASGHGLLFLPCANWVSRVIGKGSPQNPAEEIGRPPQLNLGRRGALCETVMEESKVALAPQASAKEFKIYVSLTVR